MAENLGVDPAGTTMAGISRSSAAGVDMEIHVQVVPLTANVSVTVLASELPAGILS